MNRKGLCLILLTTLICSGAAFPIASLAQEVELPEKPIGLSHDNRLRELLEAIQAHHIQPPTRQQLILDAVQVAATHQKSPLPPGFAAKLSGLSDVDALYAMMDEELTRSGASQLPDEVFDHLMMSELSKVVDGGFHLIPRKEQAVNEQLAANRYVGIGIQVGTNADTNEPKIIRTMDGGSAYEAGIKEADIIESVDGQPTKDVPLAKSIDWLRGPEGSIVNVTIRRDGERRNIEIVRRVVPLQTVKLISDHKEPTVVILRPDRIAASTVHEFRKAASGLDESVTTVVVDLRSESGGSIHHLHLLADAILDEVKCGFVETRTERRPLHTEAGTFCDGRQIAIVYVPSGSSRIDWLAATAAANNVAVFHEPAWDPRCVELMPSATPGTLEAFPILNGTFFIELNASRLLMSDGSAASTLDPVGVALVEDSPAPVAENLPLQQVFVGNKEALPGETPIKLDVLTWRRLQLQNKQSPERPDDASLMSRIRKHLDSKGKQ